MHICHVLELNVNVSSFVTYNFYCQTSILHYIHVSNVKEVSLFIAVLSIVGK